MSKTKPIRIPAHVNTSQQAAMNEFHDEFEQLCRKHSLAAMYVLVATTGPQGSKLITGGAKTLCAFVDECLNRSQAH